MSYKNRLKQALRAEQKKIGKTPTKAQADYIEALEQAIKTADTYANLGRTFGRRHKLHRSSDR